FIRSGPYFNSKIIKAGEILLVVKFHRLFHIRVGFCPSLFILAVFALIVAVRLRYKLTLVANVRGILSSLEAITIILYISVTKIQVNKQQSLRKELLLLYDPYTSMVI
ncbi:hypothetical protein ACSVDA_24730, partial [Cytobacillus sp. Hm23]